MPKEINTTKAEQKIQETLVILRDLELPKAQQNERSALTLISLLDVKPEDAWRNARAPLMGITPMMDFFAEHYGKKYAPNTRETVRRQTVHQFVQAGIVLLNPDDPGRPTNSPSCVYQIEPKALSLIREFGNPAWTELLQRYLRTVKTLRKIYARERDQARIPVKVAEGQKIYLSPGGQNVLVRKIVEDFCPLFTPSGVLIHVGDTGSKWAYLDKRALRSLGVKIEEHGKMPDVVVHHVEKNWLVLVEAVTSHGPVDAKRRLELLKLFKGSRASLVYVT